jgi:hypothetical protein
MRKWKVATFALLAASLLLTRLIHAAPPLLQLIAIGKIDALYEDFATQTAGPLESGIPGNRLGGMGSGLAYLGGDYFLALPDRGPNAADYNDCDISATNKDALDNTQSYINRFHTVHMTLAPSDPGSALPFTLTPMVVGTTLLSSRRPLVYGPGCGAVGSGVPPLNAIDHTYYFTGRSDNFDPTKNSLNPDNARFDTEGIRVSNDWRRVYISDEYGPYVYEFDRVTGRRTRVFSLPAMFAITAANMSGHGANEIPPPDGTGSPTNVVGRVTNKGMEGLAITPDGKTLVGAMQTPLIQDGGNKLVAGQFARIVTIDIKTGATHQYAYPLDGTTKTTISEILAVNDHQFLVDERDSKGLADDSNAAFKKLYLIDIEGAVDVSGLSGQANLAANALFKPSTPFLDIVQVLVANGIPVADIPAKLEGIAFGQDVTIGGAVKHTIYVSNDNDYTAVVANKTHLSKTASNPNQFFVFAFDDNDLPGFVPQQFKASPEGDDDHNEDRD